MRSKIKLNDELHLEVCGGYYYKPYTSDGIEIKGVLLKDCSSLYGDDTWEMITTDDGYIDVGPFHWGVYERENLLVNYFMRRLNKQNKQ